MPLELRKFETKRRRGLIVYLLYLSRPKSVELGSLITLLDARNYPLTRRRLAEDLDFVRAAGLIRITTPSSELILNEAQQEKLLHRFAESDGDSDNDFCARLTQKGLNFQEELVDELGIVRVS